MMLSSTHKKAIKDFKTVTGASEKIAKVCVRVYVSPLLT
jgi:hypothetical protein